jgi:hypothetical protein
MLPAAALTLALAPNGAGEAPPHLGAALAEQRQLSQQRPNDAGVWNDLGNLLVLRGDFDEAEIVYIRAIELDPSSTAARFNLALLRQQSGDLDWAIADYVALLEVDPGNAWAQYQLGAAYEAQGLRSLALDRYAQAFTLDPELLFAETNPHIIENRLVTEALLRARRGSRSGPPAPRAYVESGRITSILTPGAPTPATPDTPAAQEAQEDDGPSPDASFEPLHAPFAPSHQLRARPGETADSAQLAPPRDRVLDSNDLRGSVRNQVQGAAAPDSGMPLAPGNRRRAGASVNPAGGRRNSLLQPPASDGSSAFGLGQRSTGALEWRLGPASDEPVPAR